MERPERPKPQGANELTSKQREKANKKERNRARAILQKYSRKQNRK